MLIVREKREQLFIMYLLKSNKKHVAKLHVFRAPKNSHVADVARLPFGQFRRFNTYKREVIAQTSC
jgi:hypothetical protein